MKKEMIERAEGWSQITCETHTEEGLLRYALRICYENSTNEEIKIECRRAYAVLCDGLSIDRQYGYG